MGNFVPMNLILLPIFMAVPAVILYFIIKTAIKNAKKLLESYGENHNPEIDNPSTTIYKLVEILNNLKDKES